jgi:hypothetical protein
MMPLVALAAAFSALGGGPVLPAALALFPEEAGRLDFLVATAGHGPVRSAALVAGSATSAPEVSDPSPSAAGGAAVLTWSSPSTSAASCYVASRRVLDGSLLWRRNACSSGFASAPSSSLPGADEEGVEGVEVAVTTSLSPDDGDSSAVALARWVHALDVRTGVLRTFEADSGSLAWELIVEESSEAGRRSASSSPSPMLWTFSRDGRSYVAASLSSSSGSPRVFEAGTGETVQNLKAPSPPPQSAPATGVECARAKLRVAAASEGDPSALVATLAAAPTPVDRAVDWQPLRQASAPSRDDDPIRLVAMLSCTATQVQALVASARGSTALVVVDVVDGGRDLAHRVSWTAQEGLGQASSALLLDSSHYVGDLDADRSHRLLSLPSRLRSQWDRVAVSARAVLGWVSGEEEGPILRSRQALFGFVKTAVFLVPGRVVGVGTVGRTRGQLVYQVDVPSMEDGWTSRLIHSGSGASTTFHAVGGGSSASSTPSEPGEGGTTHHRDVLVVSTRGTELRWVCFDGTTGAVHDRGGESEALAAPLVQISPLPGAVPATCRQSALLHARDGSTRVVPDTEASSRALTSQLQRHNGMYTHSITREGDDVRLVTYHVSWNGDRSLQSQRIGSALFPGERLVRVAYPRREEAIESPCLAQGDDSVLLKYLNPHLAVMITMRRSGAGRDESDASIADALKSSKTVPGSASKRKPLGATGSSSSGAAPEAPSVSSNLEDPNLFVNVVDTVSGRLLYRASHSHALSAPIPSAVVSENWIFYSFSSDKTRRAELGVLSLYEGMIDSKGLTAFTSPDRTPTFSSLDARESKPVVLAKTYGLPRPVTALGMTLTKSGISGRRLVLSGVDGRVYTLDRKSLEPRRPVGPLKDSEKKEGLMQYSEFIPFIPYLVLSHNRTVEGVRHILTAPTDLESQTLVLAYGGPDVFFARTSPSRGFDLLPDSFNRVVLSLVVLGLFAVTGILRHRASKKFQKQGWM